MKEIAAFGKSELEAPWVEEQIQLLDAEDYQRAYQRMRRKQRGTAASFNDYEDEKEILGRMVVSDRLKPLRRWVKALRFVDMTKLYTQLFDDASIAAELGLEALPEDWSAIGRQTIDKIRAGEMYYEDATPFLYLKELVLGFRSNTDIRHVIIDEAQDYSPFQLFFLKRLFPRARMTALGDLNQAIYAHASVLQQSATLTDLYGTEESELIVLKQSYRSTREIVEFTKGMIAGGEDIVPFSREGEKPLVRVLADREALHREIRGDLSALRKDGYETIAVICKTAEQSEQVYEMMLTTDLPVKLIKKTTLSFEKGIHIIPAYLAKGVEFDAVLIYDGSNVNYTKEAERKLFYTACTRAMHLLHIYSIGEPSRFVKESERETYIQSQDRKERNIF
ncbi:Helicase IV [compost metagenome]